MSNDQDVMCRNILNGLTQLESIITVAAAEHSFDVATHAECREKYHELRRLKRSLEQYSSKAGALTYIGFIGHFSSGKSCTINSLLEQEGAPDGRRTGLHPTDKAVTLITHPSNSGCLIGMHRRGEIEVGSSLVANAMLENVVLVDTPGSGDPSVMEEMVRDFLPICDWIVYVFSAAIPLDSTDLPILRKAHLELPFIPMKFLVTRGDEFRKDRNAPLTETNFDQQKADQFIAEFMARLAAAIPGKSVSPNDILLVDNLDGFHLDSLRSLINDPKLTNTTNHLHSHKIVYFLESAKKIRDFFTRYLEEKIRAARSLLLTAQTNHQNYQETVSVANSRLTESWSEQRRKLNDMRNRLSVWTNNISPFDNLPSEPAKLPVVTMSLSLIQKDLTYWAKSTAETLCRSLKSTFVRKLSDRVRDLAEEISSSKNWEQVGITSHVVPMTSERYLTDIPTQVPPKVLDSAKELTEKAAEDIRLSATRLLQGTEKLLDAVQRKGVVSESCGLVSESSEQISEMLNDFFKSVKLYKAAILAINARELAQKVGIIKAIDELEKVDLAETRRATWTERTTSSIFLDYNEKRQECTEALNTQVDGLLSLLGNVKRLHGRDQQEQLRSHLRDWRQEADFKDRSPLHESIHKAVDGFIQASSALFEDLDNKRNSLLLDRKQELDQDIRQMRRSRFRRLGGWTIFGSILGLLVYLFYYYKYTPIEQTLPYVIALGIGVNLVSTLVTWALGMATDKTKSKIDQSRREYSEQTRRRLLELLKDSKLEDWGFVDDLKPKFEADLMDIWSSEIKDNMFASMSDAFDSFLNELVRCFEVFNMERARYSEACDKFIKDLIAYYADTERNLNLLAEVSSGIKEEAILPSFNLLEERAKQLDTQMQELNHLQFA
ncbi:MAG: hypothetical protein ACOYXY_15170 [Thermodesulfobacteriota bacterium]